VSRTVIRKIVAKDAAGSTGFSVEPGAVLEDCRVVRNDVAAPAVDVYVVEFEFAGRRLHYPLVDFQARTEALQPVPLQGSALETATIS